MSWFNSKCQISFQQWARVSGEGLTGVVQHFRMRKKCVVWNYKVPYMVDFGCMTVYQETVNRSFMYTYIENHIEMLDQCIIWQQSIMNSRISSTNFTNCLVNCKEDEGKQVVKTYILQWERNLSSIPHLTQSLPPPLLLPHTRIPSGKYASYLNFN